MEAIGVGRRAVAVIIDSILLFIVGYLIAAVSGQTTAGGFHIQGAPFFVWLAIALAYYIVMEATSGATLGKRAMHLKVVKQDGAALDWQAAIVRNVLRLVDGLFFYLVGAIVVWASKSRQRLGDMAANTLVVSARLWLVGFAAACALALPGQGFAGSPRYEAMVLSDSADGAAKDVFKPATAKLYLRTKLVDAPKGTRVRADWIAEKTRVAPPNYKIDSVEMKAGGSMNQVRFNMSKPNAGWPEGDYRVELFIDGKPAGRANFRVVR